MRGTYEVWCFRKIASMEAEIRTNCYYLRQLNSLNCKLIVTNFLCLKCLCEKALAAFHKNRCNGSQKTEENVFLFNQIPHHNLFFKYQFQYFCPIYA